MSYDGLKRIVGKEILAIYCYSCAIHFGSDDAFFHVKLPDGVPVDKAPEYVDLDKAYCCPRCKEDHVKIIVDIEEVD